MPSFKLPAFSAALMAAVLPLTGGTLTATTASAAPAVNTVAATTRGCTSPARTTFSQAQGIATAPSCVGTAWSYALPATSSPSTPRRTESHWSDSKGIHFMRAGDTVTYEADYLTNLGAAAYNDNNWHVIWQLHGPIGTAWNPPVLDLYVRKGELRLGGGSGHPNQNWSTRNYEWIRKLATYQDNKPFRVKIQAYLSSDPKKGWVSAWVNGVQVLNQYRPTSYAGGLQPGTYYPGQSYVASRTGLYRGTQSGAIPTYRQSVTAKVIQAY